MEPSRNHSSLHLKILPFYSKDPISSQRGSSIDNNLEEDEIIHKPEAKINRELFPQLKIDEIIKLNHLQQYLSIRHPHPLKLLTYKLAQFWQVRFLLQPKEFQKKWEIYFTGFFLDELLGKNSQNHYKCPILFYKAILAFPVLTQFLLPIMLKKILQLKQFNSVAHVIAALKEASHIEESLYKTLNVNLQIDLGVLHFFIKALESMQPIIQARHGAVLILDLDLMSMRLNSVNSEQLDRQKNKACQQMIQRIIFENIKEQTQTLLQLFVDDSSDHTINPSKPSDLLYLLRILFSRYEFSGQNNQQNSIKHKEITRFFNFTIQNLFRFVLLGRNTFCIQGDFNQLYLEMFKVPGRLMTIIHILIPLLLEEADSAALLNTWIENLQKSLNYCTHNNRESNILSFFILCLKRVQPVFESSQGSLSPIDLDTMALLIKTMNRSFVDVQTFEAIKTWLTDHLLAQAKRRAYAYLKELAANNQILKIPIREFDISQHSELRELLKTVLAFHDVSVMCNQKTTNRLTKTQSN